MIISLGIQCLNASLKQNINMDSERMPFDWMLSNPKFVYEMLVLLLDINMDIRMIVENHFFNIDKKASILKHEYYITDPNGIALYNSKYDVIFPHDVQNEETINKYIRRFNRLKDTILNSKEKQIFLYTSQSSDTNGNFMIDDRPIISDVYLYMSKIYELINKYNSNNKMIILDSIKNEQKDNLNKNILVYELIPCDNWDILLKQILQEYMNGNKYNLTE
jgi:Putative papain-like cysteine peptidase (DUF1796)